MRRTSLGVGLLLLAPLGTALAQVEAPVSESTAVAGASASKFQVGVAFLPMLVGRVATGPSGDSTFSNLNSTYGISLSVGYRIIAGLSVGVAPQVVFNLSANNSAGYSVIGSEKEYDLMARIAYAYSVSPKLDVYAEILPGYSFVTYNQIVAGSPAPIPRGIVLVGGLGAAFVITDRLFANAGLGYQLGFQTSHGISDKDVKTKFLRIALGGGVKF